VEQIGIDQGFKSLKMESKKRIPLFPAYYEDGVDYDFDDEDKDFEDYPDEDDESDDEMEEVSQEEILNLGNQNDEVENEELDDIYTNTPNIMEGNDEATEAEEDKTKSEKKIESRVKPSRTIIPVERLTYTHQQSDVKKVTFKDPVSEEMTKQNKIPNTEYSCEIASLIGHLMVNANLKDKTKGISLGPQLILQKGLKKFGNKGNEAVTEELEQLHERGCFNPINFEKLSHQERKRAMEALMYLTEKRDGTIKGRMVYNGKPTRQ